MNGSIQSVAPATNRPTRPISGLLSTAIVVVVGALLVHVLLETWAQVLSGPTSVDPRANLDGSAQWPKQLKTALYLGLAGLTVVKVAVDRLWHRFRAGADLALLVLGLVMVLAGLVNDSSMSLMGEALFVYFRGVIVFYALRAADLNSTMIRRLLVVVAVVVSVNVLLALVQMVVGEPAYRVLGWVDLTWSDQSRAQGLLSHPNHLGHVLGLTMLGFVAWLATAADVRRRWWAVAAVVAVAMSATQSRETLLGVLIGAVLIAVVARTNTRRVLAVCLLVVLCTVAQIAARPDNRAEWERRIGNAFTSFDHPAGSESSPPGPATARPTPTPTARPDDGGAAVRWPQTSTKPSTPPESGGPHGSPAAVTPQPTHSPAPVREIRVLYLQQAAKILPRQPLLGFGIGQFGGVVAEKDNPNWHKNPKFGPGGFNRYGFQAVQVDSFWLHLVMEVGVLGFGAYLVWLFNDCQTTAGPDASTTSYGPPAGALRAVGNRRNHIRLHRWLPLAFDGGSPVPPLLWTVVGLGVVGRAALRTHRAEGGRAYRCRWPRRCPAGRHPYPHRRNPGARASGAPSGRVPLR